MNAIWQGIANAANSFFIYLKPAGNTTNWLFGITITIGVIYWLWYDSKVRKGGENYMSNKGK